MNNKKRLVLQMIILMIAFLMIVYGIYREEVSIIWNKAVNICLECIGLG